MINKKIIQRNMYKSIKRDIDMICKLDGNWHCFENWAVGEREHIHNRILVVAVVDVEIVFVAPECVSFVPGNSYQ